MAITAVTCNVDVPDIAAGYAFYSVGLGFTLKAKLAATIYELEAAGMRLFLLEKAAHSTPTPDTKTARSYDRHWTPVHIDLEVDDLESALRQALAAGAKVESQSTSDRWGTIAVCADPFGNGFCLIKPPHIT